MRITSRKEHLVLFMGDVICFALALYLTLLVRYGAIPTDEVLETHLVPFGILFFIWSGVYFVAGLYEKHTVLLKSRLPSILLNVQIINSLIAVLFFYLIPIFDIAPKRNLFIHLFFSFILVLIWRLYGLHLIGTSHKERALLMGTGEEMKELRDEVNNNNRYDLEFVSTVDVEELDGMDIKEEIINRVYSEGITSIVVDLQNNKINTVLPQLYNLIFSKVRFIDIHKVYEDIFDRIPLSLVHHNWFLENISASSRFTYDTLKRMMDIIVSSILLVLSLPFYVIVWVAIRLDDGGPLFITQERIGRNNSLCKIWKFRSMSGNDQGNYSEGGVTSLTITRVGGIIRRYRIDELPQLWNVLQGDISLIGPRPELPTLVKQYEKEVPYYNVRHLIKPGLSGWAQIYGEHAHHGTDVTKTRNKLSYDLYYIKNRSFMLDVKIALRTLKILLSQSGL
ncbi:MAG: sugar transferase [Candidatus Paceibacterota bacterium]